MDSKYDEIKFQLDCTAAEAENRLRWFINQYRATVSPLTLHPEDKDKYSTAVLLDGRCGNAFKSGGKFWAMQVYIKDLGSRCEVILVSTGQPAFMGLVPAKNTFSFTKSCQRRVDLIQILQNRG